MHEITVKEDNESNKKYRSPEFVMPSESVPSQQMRVLEEKNKRLFEEV